MARLIKRKYKVKNNLRNRRHFRTDQSLRKRYIKLLSVADRPILTKQLIEAAPADVVKLICNAAIHAWKNKDIQIAKKDRKLFSNKKRTIEALSNKKLSIPLKRKFLISQRGGAFPLIPILLSTVLSTIGPMLFDKLTSSSKSNG